MRASPFPVFQPRDHYAPLTRCHGRMLVVLDLRRCEYGYQYLRRVDRVLFCAGAAVDDHFAQSEEWSAIMSSVCGAARYQEKIVL